MNTLYTVYDPTTGTILRSGHCSAQDAPLQAQAGQCVLIGVRGDDSKERVGLVDGVPTIQAKTL